MKVSDLQAANSKYLKQPDVGNGLLLTIARVQEDNLALEGQPAEKKWTMWFHETPKGLVLNRTNIILAQHVLGDDVDTQWIGHQIVVYFDPSISFRGQITGGIRVRAPKKRKVVAAPPPPPIEEYEDDEGDDAVLEDENDEEDDEVPF